MNIESNFNGSKLFSSSKNFESKLLIPDFEKVFVLENQGVYLPGGYRKFNKVLEHFWSGCCNFFVQISVTVDFDCKKNIT